MPTLRELTTRYDLQFDDRGFKKADNALKTLTSAAKGLAAVFSAAIVGKAFKTVIELASDADETMNVLNETFGGNIETVKGWASTLAKEVNRSEFELREMAGSMGAILNPLMEKNADVTAEMSMRLAQLAVDLGSFYNTIDEEAMRSLRSGIVGLPMPLRKYGIVLLESTLAEFAHAQGIKKKVTEMTTAEKTMLRYQFILDQSAQAHGDAARTAEFYANASKGLKTALRDLGTAIGMKLMPTVNRGVKSMRDMARSFRETVKSSNVLKAAMIVLGTIAVGVGIKMFLAFLPAIAMFVAVAAAIAAAIIIVDELITTFKGGKTVIGDFVDKMFGIGTTSTVIKQLEKDWFDFSNAVFDANEAVLKFRKEAWQNISELVDDWITGIGEAKQAFIKFFADVWDAYKTFAKMVIKPLQESWKMISGIFAGKKGRREERAETREEAKERRQKMKTYLAAAKPEGRGFFETWAYLLEEDKKRLDKVRAVAKEEYEGREEHARMVAKERGIGLWRARKVAKHIPRRDRGGGESPVTQNNEFNMNVNTQQSKVPISEITRAGKSMARTAGDSTKRATLEALKQRAVP